jgi:hypothetical protein
MDSILYLLARADRPERPNYRICESVSPACPVRATTYGYVPNLGANALFTAWFAILALLALGFGIRARAWTYTIALGVGTILETLGYGGRLMMNPNPWNENGFKLQICCLVLAPSALAACVYLTLKHLVNYFGPEHSLIKPRLYPWLFVGCDLGSMVLQGIGGGVAASAGRKMKLINLGNRLIIAGIAFQVVTMALCGALMSVYFLRYRKARKNGGNSSGSEKSNYQIGVETDPRARRRIATFCWAVGGAYITILIRCIYRYVKYQLFTLLTGFNMAEELTDAIVSLRWLAVGVIH